MYECEINALPKFSGNERRNTQRSMERAMLGITPSDGKRSTWIGKQIKIRDIKEVVT